MKNNSFLIPKNFKLGLYPIVNNIEWISRLLKLGVRTIQLRVKHFQNNYELEKLVHDAIILGKKYNARLFINDYWDLAIKYNAYGVHLGQEDLQEANVCAIHNAGLLLGISTHNIEEVHKATKINPFYISLGHIFPTETKHMSCPPQGLSMLKYYIKILKNKNIATVAIGGISLNSIPEVLSTGVGGVAVVSAITKAKNWQLATQQLLDLIEKNDV